MIKRLKIKNFKSLVNSNLELSNLNLFAGINGMGKSSCIQLLLLLRQSYFRDKDLVRLFLNGRYINIGTGKDAFHYNSLKEENIGLEIEWSDQVTDKFFYSYKKDSRSLESSEVEITGHLNDYSLFGKDTFQYLSAERIGPRPSYEAVNFDSSNDYELGVNGEFTFHFLEENQEMPVHVETILHKKAKSNTLLEQVSAWLTEITPGTRLRTVPIEGTDRVRLAYQFEAGRLVTEEFRPTNVGFGLTYILPILVSVLSSKKNDLLIIENPESHIHPRGQSEMGMLLARAAASGIQIIIETHSDHVLNGIRYAAKINNSQPESGIDSTLIRIHFFSRDLLDEAHSTEIMSPKIDNNGKLDFWPEGFFDEWNSMLAKLI